MPDDMRHQEEIDIRAAFAALLLDAPERSAWPMLDERLRVRRTPRWPLWLAAAAVFALAALLPRALQPPVESSTATPALSTTTPSDPLAPLMSESARLETLLVVAGSGESASGPTAALGAALEDRVASIDAALADPSLSPERRLLLWQERVATLRELAGLESTRQWLATRGGDYQGDLVLAY